MRSMRGFDPKGRPASAPEKRRRRPRAGRNRGASSGAPFSKMVNAACSPNFMRLVRSRRHFTNLEAPLADSDINELAALRLEIIRQIAIADRLGEPYLAAILCEAETCIDNLIAG